MIEIGVLAAAHVLMWSQAETEQWKAVLATPGYSIAIRFDQSGSTGLPSLTVITTDTVSPQSLPLTGQRWARIEVECADDRSGNGKVRLLGQGALDATSSPSPNSPGQIANPLVYGIGGSSPVSWVAENLCSGRLPSGKEITGDWSTIPSSLRENHDSMLAAPRRITRF